MAVIPNVVDNETIATAWGNTVADAVNNGAVRRYATIADRDASWPAASAGDGAVCVVAGRIIFMVQGGAWRVIDGQGGMTRVDSINVTGIVEPNPSAWYAAVSVTALGVETYAVTYNAETTSNGAILVQAGRDNAPIWNHTAISSGTGVRLGGTAYDKPTAGVHTYAVRVGGWYGSSVGLVGTALVAVKAVF